MISRQLSPLIELLSRGEAPATASLAALSDLGRDEAAQLRAAWPLIPAGLRVSVIVQSMELVDDSVDLDFIELGLIALDDVSAEVRVRAAESLFDAPQRSVAIRLLSRLNDDSDHDVRAAVAGSLRQFVALRELEQGDVELGDAIVLALKAAFEDARSSVTLRASALESLGMCSLPWAAELIAEGYVDDERTVRLAALVAMGDSAEDRWLEYVVDQFYADDPEFRFSAVLAAAQIGSEDAVEPLVELLADDDPEVVTLAIAAIGEIGGELALEALLEYAETAPPEFEELVSEAMQVASEFASGDEDDDFLDDPEE